MVLLIGTPARLPGRLPFGLPGGDVAEDDGSYMLSRYSGVASERRERKDTISESEMFKTLSGMAGASDIELE